MTNRWWRAYDEALDDPKIQRLTGEQFKAWFNLMCLASKHGGRLPGMFEIAFALRTNEQRAASALTELVTFRLFERDGDGYAPHNWRSRQYDSDTSKLRMRRYRERHSDVTVTSDVTGCDDKVECHQKSPSPSPSPSSPTPPITPSPYPSPSEAETESDIGAVGEKAPTRPSIRTRCEELFEELWKAKPRRDGANPRKPAFEKFGRLVDGSKAADWELATRIIAGAERWAAEEARRGVIGTDKVAQLITWLNQARWEGYPAQEAASAPPAGFYAAFGSPELDAWDTYRTDFEGRKFPRDKRGGWSFPTQWPAGYEPKSDVTVTNDDTPTIGR